MAWEVVTKRVRGTATKAMPGSFAGSASPPMLVRFDTPEYNAREGREVHAKLYDDAEEAIQELGARIVERVLRDDEDVKVTVSISLPKWVEE